jgi:ADP-heptose:LPS heptosyltransferase
MCGKHPHFHDLIGATTIGQLMALVSRASMVIANDSAALHMAVGFNRALIALFGPTDVSRVGPFKREADVIQHLRESDVLTHKNPANVAIMERITVDEVWDMVTKRL